MEQVMEPWIGGALIGAAGIAIGLVTSVIALNGRIVSLEVNTQHHYERLKNLDSKIFKDHEKRISSLEKDASPTN